jgi:hypothetical protein
MADGAAARKILLCGDVGGSLGALYKRFETVRRRAPGCCAGRTLPLPPVAHTQPPARHPPQRPRGAAPAGRPRPKTLSAAAAACRALPAPHAR